MSKQSRSKSRIGATRKSNSRADLEILTTDGVVIDINTFTLHTPRKSSRNNYRRIEAKNRSQGQYMAAIASYLFGPCSTRPRSRQPTSATRRRSTAAVWH